MSGISVVILTLNEEVNVGECIDSCAPWCNDIVLFDSLSSDRTREIALSKGVRVVTRVFDHYAGQRNAALTTVNYKHDWVFMVDADERVPPDLAKEALARVEAAPAEVTLFRVRRKDYFLGRWLRRSSGYPTWFGRLMRVGRVRVEREVNEEYVTDGRIALLNAHLLHYPFNRGIAFWFERHNRYSTMEAARLGGDFGSLRLMECFSLDPVLRRKMLKRYLYRVPFRPLIVFLYLYLFRLGILDGRAGFYFSRMRAAYEFFIDLKALESERRRRGMAV
jgi:glycosyltransferase involved in cell wall biosynthesis